MCIKSIVLATATLVFTHSTSAAIVDNGTYTTVDGIDWLDLTATAGMSYNEVNAQLGVGGSYEGWTYASRAQVEGLWTAFGGDPAYYNGWSSANGGLFEVIAPLFGDLYCVNTVQCSIGQGFSTWITGDKYSATQQYGAYSTSTIRSPGHENDGQSVFLSSTGSIASIIPRSDQLSTTGSALVRVHAVPAPPRLSAIRLRDVRVIRDNKKESTSLELFQYLKSKPCTVVVFIIGQHFIPVYKCLALHSPTTVTYARIHNISYSDAGCPLMAESSHSI